MIKFIREIFLCETPEEKILREQWEKRLNEIIKKMRK
jgi:hypothetical protein